jgi:urease accessory protein
MELDFRILQLCDSAFPTGGFAHSSGTEAAWQQGEIRGPDELYEWLLTSLRQLGRSALPFVRAGRAHVSIFEPLDAWSDAILLNHVANRASRAQGAALLSAAARTFERPPLEGLFAAARARRLPTHLAPSFGATCDALDVGPDAAARLFLFVNLRGMVSAAVRLGAAGPMEGQRLQQRLAGEMESIAAGAAGAGPEDAVQTAPLTEILQATQDRLYSRLFIS